MYCPLGQFPGDPDPEPVVAMLPEIVELPLAPSLAPCLVPSEKPFE